MATEFEITEAMIVYGGGFVSALGRLIRQADADNKRRLVQAFPEYVERYRQIADGHPMNEQAKRHRCMRCGEEFDCQHGPNCVAGAYVMPDIVTPDGRGTVEHCPQHPTWDWIRAYGKRRETVGYEKARTEN